MNLKKKKTENHTGLIKPIDPGGIYIYVLERARVSLLVYLRFCRGVVVGKKTATE